MQLSGPPSEKQCTRAGVDFVRKGSRLVVNEIALTSLCMPEASAAVAEERLTPQYGALVDRRVQEMPAAWNTVMTNLRWGPPPLTFEDVLSHPRMQATVRDIHLRKPKPGAEYLVASIQADKRTGETSILDLVLTDASLTQLRLQLMASTKKGARPDSRNGPARTRR